MEDKNRPYLPFDIYDFFGYLFPGVFTIILFLSFLKFGLVDKSIVDCFYNESMKFTSQGSDLFFSAFVVSIAFILLYITGHIIGSLASVFFDRMIIRNMIGYPVTTFLGLEKDTGLTYNKASHIMIFALINLGLICSVFYQIWHSWWWIGIIIPLYLIAIIIIFRFLYKVVLNNFFKLSETKFSKILDYLLIFPANYTRKTFQYISSAMGTESHIPEEIIKSYKVKFKTRFGFPCEEVGSENYWLPYFYSSQNNLNYERMFRNWLYLYGFTRNISCTCFLSAITISLFSFFYPNDINENVVIFYLILLIFLAWVFFLRYWVLYKNYHSKNVIRAFISS